MPKKAGQKKTKKQEARHFKKDRFEKTALIHDVCSKEARFKHVILMYCISGGITMQGSIKREEAGNILTKLKSCRFQLQKANIYSCLILFREILEKTLATKMLPADEKQLNKEINTFQSDLAASKAFYNLYGPVTFKDDDISTALDFMKQLIQIREEEIMAAMESAQAEGIAAESDALQQRIERMMVFVEREDVDAATALAEKDEEATDALIELYNASGIEQRKEQDFDNAVKNFKKALFLRPNDEFLYYNLARVHIDAGDWAAARMAVNEALRINPDFQEGFKLRTFVELKLQ
jgi:tetratricopeptide (TPR) repeat protein